MLKLYTFILSGVHDNMSHLIICLGTVYLPVKLGYNVKSFVDGAALINNFLPGVQSLICVLYYGFGRQILQ